jgi:two-component system, response regulator / RNA-binding antiterminator
MEEGGKLFAKLYFKGIAHKGSHTMNDSKQLKIVVINSLVAPEGADQAAQIQAEHARALRIGLLEGGYNILAALPPDADLEEQIAQLQPDVIIVDEQSDAALKKVVAASRCHCQ